MAAERKLTDSKLVRAGVASVGVIVFAHEVKEAVQETALPIITAGSAILAADIRWMLDNWEREPSPIDLPPIDLSWNQPSFMVGPTTTSTTVVTTTTTPPPWDIG